MIYNLYKFGCLSYYTCSAHLFVQFLNSSWSRLRSAAFKQASPVISALTDFTSRKRFDFNNQKDFSSAAAGLHEALMFVYCVHFRVKEIHPTKL